MRVVEHRAWMSGALQAAGIEINSENMINLEAVSSAE